MRTKPTWERVLDWFIVLLAGVFVILTFVHIVAVNHKEECVDWPIPKDRAIKIMRFHGVQFLKIETWSGIPQVFIKRDGVWIQVDEYNRYPGATPLCDTDADCHELDHLLGRIDHGGEYFGHYYSKEKGGEE